MPVRRAPRLLGSPASHADADLEWMAPDQLLIDATYRLPLTAHRVTL